MKKTAALLIAGIMIFSLAACGKESITSVILKETSEDSVQAAAQVSEQENRETEEISEELTPEEVFSRTVEPDSLSDEGSIAEVLSEIAEDETAETKTEASDNVESVLTSDTTAYDPAINAEELFTDRDLRQAADTADAQYITLTDGQNLTVTEEGVYVLKGTASEAIVTVEAADDAKVQLVLDGVNITNTDSPFIYVKNADKVFVTTTSTENFITVTGTFATDGTTNTDAAIFAKDDLVLNGTGSLTIVSSYNGISCKDDLKITGGTLNIDCAADALEANDSIAVANGTITITTRKDALHAENEDDNNTGYIYICGGTLDITANDDGIHATTIAQIDGGEITVSASEGIEATWVQLNGGTITISASDDGINASYKSGSYSPVIEINSGAITVVMGSGDTDALDSNGSLYINGGTLDITAQSPFDYDNTAEYNGGTMIVNGEETTAITNQFMGGGPGGMGGPGGKSWGGDSGWDENSNPGQAPDWSNGSDRGTPPDFGNGSDWNGNSGKGPEFENGSNI